MLSDFTKAYADVNYIHTTTVRHKGTIIAFSMDEKRRITYVFLNTNPALPSAESTAISQAASAPAQPPVSSTNLPSDVDKWTTPSPIPVPFATELAKVGFGVTDQIAMPTFRKNAAKPEAVGTILPPGQ